MKREIRALPFTYKGRSILVRGILGDYCPKCDEAVLSEAGSARYSAVLERFVKRVNRAGLPDLRAIRRRLKLTQVEAAHLFGGGVNAFSRYERGETAPPRSLVQLFRLLDHQPELLDLLRAESEGGPAPPANRERRHAVHP